MIVLFRFLTIYLHILEYGPILYDAGFDTMANFVDIVVFVFEVHTNDGISLFNSTTYASNFSFTLDILKQEHN